MSKKVTESKIGSMGFSITKRCLHSTEISNQSSMFIFFFFCTSNFLPLIILQLQTVTKYYKEPHLSRCTGCLSTGVASIFMQGGRKSNIMDLSLLTMNCNNRNYYISVSRLK